MGYLPSNMCVIHVNINPVTYTKVILCGRNRSVLCWGKQWEAIIFLTSGCQLGVMSVFQVPCVCSHLEQPKVSSRVDKGDIFKGVRAQIQATLDHYSVFF